jgi:hypothetical protein
MSLPYKYRLALTLAHFVMRFMDKIYEGNDDNWGDAPWLDIQ